MTLLPPRCAALLALAVVSVACGSDDGGGTSREVTADDFAPAWVLSEFDIEGDLVVPEGALVASVRNVGFVEHNVGIEGGPFSDTLNNEEQTDFDLGTLAPGDYVLFCDIEGHRDSGMETTLTVLPVSDGTIIVPAEG